MRLFQVFIFTIVVAFLVSVVVGDASVIINSELNNSNNDARKTASGWRKLLAEARDKLKPTIIDYGDNHPFDLYQQRRMRGLVNDGSNKTINSAYQPIRIKFMTESIESLRGQISQAVDEEINDILNDVLPFVQNKWSNFLSVYPTNSPIPVNTNNDCFGLFQDDFTAQQQQPQQQSFITGNDVDGNTIIEINDADLVIIVSAKDTLTFADTNKVLQVCGETVSTTLAVASPCTFDQWDRPIVGFINFCLSSKLDRSRRRRNQQQKRQREVLDGGGGGGDGVIIEVSSSFDTSQVATHEIGHILGMDSDLFKYFRNGETGEPLTPRPFEESNQRCVDGSVQRVRLPADNTIRPGQTNRGIFYYSIVTPRVQQVVRNHFNCQSLVLGARLENQPTGDTCFGSHWDELLFSSELMSPVFEDKEGSLTALTLALLEDTGWYKVCYTNADLSSYGFGLGCGFVESDCIVNDQVPETGVFCNSPIRNLPVDASSDDLPVYCDPFHRSFGLCDLFDFESDQVRNGIEMPSDPITYFSNPNWVGTNRQRDFCPLPTISFNVDCNVEDSNNSPEYVGESYGPAGNNRCVNAFSESSATGQRRMRPACMSLFCDKDLRKVIIGDRVCQNDGDLIPVTSNLPGQQNAMIECPRLTAVCPQLFCPGSCNARGVCNFETGSCECLDPEDTSEYCTASGDIVSCPLNPLYYETRPPSRPPTPSPESSSGGARLSFWSAFVMTSLVMFLPIYA